MPNDRPPVFRIDETRRVNPSQLPPGGPATFPTKIRVNPYAANWTTAGNLGTVGFLRELPETRNSGTPLIPSHDGDPAIWFQNNNPEGVGFCWDKQFVSNNAFVFTQSGVSQCGLPRDNATQTAPAPGSFVKYSVTVFADNTYRLVVEHLNDAATAFAGRLVFEPYLSPGLGAVQQNVWQSWDARAGKWYGTRTTATVGNVAGVAQPCQPATPCTWQQVLALFPNAGVRNTAASALLFKVGGPWSPGFDGNVDALILNHVGSRITYDFEHAP